MLKLKILIYSPFYLPKIGGLENTISAVALEYHRAGHEVRVITKTPTIQEIDVPYQILRNPNKIDIFKAYYWCDVIHQPNISLKGLWPLFILRRTLCISHHTTNYRIDGSISFIGKLKYWLAKKAYNASCSNYTNSLLYKSGEVIHSPYNEKQFYYTETIIRNFDLVFLGRLVSDKGVDFILRAMEELKKKGMKPTLSIIGEGPEKERLKKIAFELKLDQQVEFKGSLTGEALTKALNSHKVLIAPSIWEEPFGKVALEGLACGCKVIVADSGGLPEAAGPTGLIFKKGDVSELAEKIIIALKDKNLDLTIVQQHLNSHSMSEIGKYYNNWIINSYLDDQRQH